MGKRRSCAVGVSAVPSSEAFPAETSKLDSTILEAFSILNDSVIWQTLLLPPHELTWPWGWGCQTWTPSSLEITPAELGWLLSAPLAPAWALDVPSWPGTDRALLAGH